MVQDSILYISDVSFIPEDVWNYLLPSETSQPISPVSNGTTTNGSKGFNDDIPTTTTGTNGLYLTNGANGTEGGKKMNGIHSVNGVNGVGSNGYSHPSSSPSSPSSSPSHRGPPVLILDCLRLNAHTSHLGLGESITFAQRFDAQRTYITGFEHEVAHDEYVTLTEAVTWDDDKMVSDVQNTIARGSSGRSSKVIEGLDILAKSKEKYEGDWKKIWVRPAFDGLKVTLGEDGVVRDDGYVQ